MNDDTTLPITLDEDDEFIAAHDGVFYNIISKPPKHGTHRLQCTPRLVTEGGKDLFWCLAKWLQDPVEFHYQNMIDERIIWILQAFNKHRHE